MSTLNGQDLFGSGPHTIRPGSWPRAQKHRGFPGVDGQLVIDLGRRARTIEQTGRLQAGTASQLAALIDAIVARHDGNAYTLVDNHGLTHANVLIDSFAPQTPLRRGAGYWCDYTLTYTQLP
jgi:hypothetical protein